MAVRPFPASAGGILLAALTLGVTAPAATGQTPLPAGHEIKLLPGFAHEPRRGIDSIVGLLAKKDGLQINFEMGGGVLPGAPRFGGSYVNQALRLPGADRLWLKEQAVGGRTFHVAYGKDHLLIISSASAKTGVNFHAVAKTPEDVADVLLMVLTLTEQKAKKEK